jgi:hypothetical protein
MQGKAFLPSRRGLLISGVVSAACVLTRSTAPVLQIGRDRHGQDGFGPSPPASAKTAIRTDHALSSLDPKLVREALAALDRHSGAIAHRDRLAIVDFSASSSRERVHFLDVANGEVWRSLVAHGAGSDPDHTGFVQRFSNAFDSNASSRGAYVTGDYYIGKHGRSQRLTGLDPSNNNARGRAIVIHGAWYANRDILHTHAKLGRSQGCFAFGEADLDRVFSHLGEGRLIYAAKT